MTALVAMIAPPGAGKSTWAGLRFTATQIINLDSLRGWVCDDPGNQDATGDAVAVQHMLLRLRCRRRLLTVADSTNLRTDVRAELIGHAHRNLMLPAAVVLDTPLEVCRARNAARPQATRVPDQRLIEMYEQFAKMVPAAGGVDGFSITRRIGPGYDLVHGPVPVEHRNAVWLQ